MATEPWGGPDSLSAPSVAGAAAVPDVDEVEGASEPQAASAAVRASARTTLNRVTYLVVRVLVIFFLSRS